MKIKFCILLILCGAAACSTAQSLFTVTSATVENYNGRPVIMINGQPQYPLIYALTDVPGGRWSWEELPAYNLRNFYDHGFRLFQVDLFFDHVWNADGTINLDTAQKQLRGVINACPFAAIIIRFHVNPPKWWQHQHPEENTLYADTVAKSDIGFGIQRIIEDDEESPARTSLASARWKQEAGSKLKEFLQHLQELPEGKSVAGIQVAGGVYGEWHYWGFIENEPDMSAPMQQYFRQWLKEKYRSDKELQKAWKNNNVKLDNAMSPSLQQRRFSGAGIFHDPQKERNIIDYYEAQHNCVADDIILFCTIIKQTWKRPIITGAFYGYFYAVFGREATGGHLAVQKILNSPSIDFLSGPNTYYPDSKETGEVYRSRGMINSVLLHDKLWLDEMDQQTPLLPLKDSLFNTSLAQSIANVRRNMMFTYTHGTGFWFYDFGPSGFNGGARLNDHGSYGWWDEPTLMHDIEKWKKFFDSSLQHNYSSDADVLVVHDTKTFYYTGSDKKYSYMAHWANNWIPPAIFKSGAIHDVIDIEDLDKVNITQYKVVLFINTWVLNDKKKDLIKNKIAKNKRSLVWIYAPGYCNEKEINKKFITDVTGIKLKKVETAGITVLVVDSNLTPNNRINVWGNRIDPLFAADDDKATMLGNIEGTGAAGFVKKQMNDYTSWFIAVPPADNTLWRYIFNQSGAHIYEDAGDVIYSGNGCISVHTAKGGKRKIALKNGRNISLDIASNSTTILNNTTGEIINE